MLFAKYYDYEYNKEKKEHDEMNKGRYMIYFIKNSWHVFLYRLFRKKRNIIHFMHHKGITIDYSNEILKSMITSDMPFMAVRFGAVELSCINNYEKILLGFKKGYKEAVKYSIKNNAGVFPVDDESLTKYVKEATEAFNNASILGISGIHMEDYFYQNLCLDAKIIQYEAFEPLRGDWIQALKGKKVLVISPFAEDIEKQYQIIDKLYPKGVIPSFHLKTFQCVQTIGEEKDKRFKDWSEALSFMKNEISKMDFDVALVGAGAYGSPLCSYIYKSLGKQAIQTGGATATMFGIMGKRWENRPHVAQYVNEYWIRPSHKPKGYEKVEKGCYW